MGLTWRRNWLCEGSLGLETGCFCVDRAGTPYLFKRLCHTASRCVTRIAEPAIRRGHWRGWVAGVICGIEYLPINRAATRLTSLRRIRHAKPNGISVPRSASACRANRQGSRTRIHTVRHPELNLNRASNPSADCLHQVHTQNQLLCNVKAINSLVPKSK